MLVNVQYLDLSHNYIVNVEGLEAMKDLKVLCLNANLIANITSLRPLSYNRYDSSFAGRSPLTSSQGIERARYRREPCQ